MSTGYFAQVTDGVVSDVRRVTAERIEQNPDLYPGNWVEVETMDQYPAVGWTWNETTGFQPPPEEVVIE
jgi:hypothetical protein